MTTCSTPRSCRKTTFVTFVAVLSAISLSCNALSGLLPTAGEEAGEQGAGQGAAPLEAVEAPAVLGFVLDPDGAPVAYASVEGEIADSNGAVSGDLIGSASGWLEVSALGYATGYVKPGKAIGETAFFEARLTPFDSLQPLQAGEEVVLRLGDAAAPVGEISLTGDDVSALPANLKAAVYDLVDVGPYPVDLDSGEALELKLAIAVVASSDQLEPVPLASGKTLALKLAANASLPEDPVMAIFDAEKGVWEVQADACTPGEEGAFLCAVPRFSPLVGFFGPGEEVSRVPGLAKHLPAQDPTDDDQAYQDAKTDVEVWAYVGQGQAERTGEMSAEWNAEMANRIGKLADAAEAYAATHSDTSGISHLLGAAQLALMTGMDPAIADKLMKDARAIVEAAAEALLEESDCGRIGEMLLAAQQLMLLGGSQAIIDALMQKKENLFDCDIWLGTISVWFMISSSPPGGLDWALESGGSWFENHTVTMTTNIQTYVLTGEDVVKLDFGEVKYGEYDRHGCHNYVTHAGQGGSVTLKFDGRYDGYTFTVGDLQPEGGTASITYGAHGERYDSLAEKCVEIGDVKPSAPNYSSVLVHGFSGSPPITIQEMLERGAGREYMRGSEYASNNAYELGIIPAEKAYIQWSFFHQKKGLPVKQ